MSDHRPLLVVAAMRQELAPFAARSAAGDVECLVTGIGRNRTRQTLAARLSGDAYRALVIAGFAGGAVPGLSAGDLLAADEVVEADSGERFYPTVPRKGNFPVKAGRLVSLSRPAWTPAAKRNLGKKFQAVGLDMEGAEAARQAVRAGVPWCAVKAVLDPMEDFLFSFGTIGAMRLAGNKLAAYLETFKGESQWT